MSESENIERQQGAALDGEYAARHPLQRAMTLNFRSGNVPLTTYGNSIQILASISALREHHQYCTINDCKVVVSHLVRKFTEPLDRQSRQKRFKSQQVANGATDDTVQDHAVPVIVLVEKLMTSESAELQIIDVNIESIEKLLEQSLLLVEVTRQEDLHLSASGLQRHVPLGWSEVGHPLYLDPLARYKEARIEVYLNNPAFPEPRSVSVGTLTSDKQVCMSRTTPANRLRDPAARSNSTAAAPLHPYPSSSLP